LGFGAVLLGITIDAALHVYFALRKGAGSVAQRLQAVARPVRFGALTSMAAFAVLLGSDLPGQRQLAVFAISGIAIALILALVVLPHLVQPPIAPEKVSTRKSHPRAYLRWCASPQRRALVIGAWLLLVLTGAWYIQDLQVNGSLRQLSYTPADLHQAEQNLAQNWGDMRGRALIFAAAPELVEALARNEQVWKVLQDEGLEASAVSVAPLLSSPQTQDARLQRWEEFWDTHASAATRTIQRRAAGYGFAPHAFAPFRKRLEEKPPVLEPERLRAWGLGQMLDALIQPPATRVEGSEGHYRVLTLVPDTPEVVESLSRALEPIPGVTLVSQSRFGTHLAQAVGADFKRFILGAGLAVVAFLVLLFRRLPPVLLALIPVISGLVAMYGGMGWLGLELNMFNVVASILIIGLGVDYGIFMVCQGHERIHLASGRAILLSGITTLIGFGVLVLAQHPALFSIGITVLLGISAAVPAAVLVIPAFQGQNHTVEDI
ncbi:MAG: MMPL family transporter, partial [Geobacteraceae bacterium]|nr:MMPL family transporter [Geobacteraceae bacterium]